jgi:hypothetical protein
MKACQHRKLFEQNLISEDEDLRSRRAQSDIGTRMRDPWKAARPCMSNSRRPTRSFFDDNTLALLASAFMAAWMSLQAGMDLESDRKREAAREILTIGIVKTALLGERDLERLRDAALAQFIEETKN